MEECEARAPRARSWGCRKKVSRTFVSFPACSSEVALPDFSRLLHTHPGSFLSLLSPRRGRHLLLGNAGQVLSQTWGFQRLRGSAALSEALPLSLFPCSAPSLGADNASPVRCHPRLSKSFSDLLLYHSQQPREVKNYSVLSIHRLAFFFLNLLPSKIRMHLISDVHSTDSFQ